MTRTVIQVSEAAADDVLQQADWYSSRSDADLANRWESAVTSTILRIAEYPRSGSRCHFKSAELGGVRRVLVDGFPKHLIFYREGKGSILILRVLHGARDLESLF